MEVYISYNMGTQDLPDVYAHTLGHIYQENSSCPFYNYYISTTVISHPDNVTICEGGRAVFTCVLNSNIRSGDVQWYRFIKDTSTTEMVDPNVENINFLTRTNGNTSSSLTITNAIKFYTGYFWVETPSLNVSVCNASLTVATSTYVDKVHLTQKILQIFSSYVRM